MAMNFLVYLLFLVAVYPRNVAHLNASSSLAQQMCGNFENEKPKSSQEITARNSYPIHSPVMDSTIDSCNSDLHKSLQLIFLLEKTMLFSGVNLSVSKVIPNLYAEFLKFPVTATEGELHEIMTNMLVYLSEFCDSYKVTFMLFKEQLKQLGKDDTDIKPYVDLVMKIQMDFTKPVDLSIETEEALNRVIQHQFLKKWLYGVKVVYPRGAKLGLVTMAWDDGLQSAIRELLSPNLLFADYESTSKSWYAEIMVNRSSSLGMLKIFIDRAMLERQRKKSVVMHEVSVIKSIDKPASWLTRFFCGTPQT